MQCVGNSLNNCGDGRTYVAPGSPVGLVARNVSLTRDQLINNDWWSYNGYLQDSYSRGKIRINAGLRFDWQQSKWLGGCVPENPVIPEALYQWYTVGRLFPTNSAYAAASYQLIPVTGCVSSPVG